MYKHAFLIMAHNNFSILKITLKLLDDFNNDIYVHIDKKATDFDVNDFMNVCTKSKVVFLKRRLDVRWGRQSQVKLEMLLMKTAFRSGYKYQRYHIISGTDIPIKSNNYIHSLFQNTNDEVINTSKEITKFDTERLSRYHIKFKRDTFNNLLDILHYKFKIDRLKNCKLKIYKGANWASLTHNAVSVLLKNTKKIMELTRFSLCADEMYKQIILLNNGFDLYKNKSGEYDNLRFVIWQGVSSHPKTLTVDDYEDIISSDSIFARKFDENTDMDVVNKLFDRFNKTE